MNLKIAGAVALTAGLVLAGCSSDDDDATTETEETAEATTEAMDESDDADTDEPGTIVEVAASNEDFSTLVAAVEAAGLVGTLDGEGPFTVFAPTNEAFDALPEGVLDALLLPENEAVLTSILTYHVVAGEITSDQITDGDVETVEGQSVTISTEDGAAVDNAVLADDSAVVQNGSSV